MTTSNRAKGRTLWINGQEIDLRDSSPTARDALLAGGYKPPSEHQLLSIEGGRIRQCPHEDVLDDRTAHFRAFETDELWAFTVDEVSQVWGAETAEVSELLEIFNVGDDHELVLERDGEPDLVLTADGEVAFGSKGVEDLVTRRRRPEKVLVSVLTTNGVFPLEGVIRVEPDTLVASVLARAARKLELTDTAGWVVSFDGRDINAALTFAQNGLSGTVALAWNAPEGGGGA